MKHTRILQFATFLMLAVGLSGCEGDIFLFGNMATMGVTCAMLWSTVHLKKDA